jgi:hypothetical protein
MNTKITECPPKELASLKAFEILALASIQMTGAKVKSPTVGMLLGSSLAGAQDWQQWRVANRDTKARFPVSQTADSPAVFIYSRAGLSVTLRILLCTTCPGTQLMLSRDIQSHFFRSA